MNLPDVNVLLAMTVKRHVHFPVADRWYGESTARGDLWGICRITALGFLRLLTNPILMGPDVLSAAKSWGVLDDLAQDPYYRFLDEPADCWDHFRKMTREQLTGSREWTDAYLAAFALCSGCRIVTFDRAIGRRPGVRCIVLASSP